MTNQLKSALDAVGTAADYSARATYQRGYEAGQSNDSTRALMAQINSLVIQRDAAEALARERGDALEIVRADENSGLAVVARTMPVIQRLESDLAKVTSDRDAAQQMVAEMRATFGKLLKDHHVGHGGFPRAQCGVCMPIDAALALSTPIAGRWCLASERDEAVKKANDMEMRADDNEVDADAYRSRGYYDLGALYDAAIARAIAAERRESELGLQVVAQAARLRLADDVVAMARLAMRTVDGSNEILADALAAWDAVPGDVGGQS